MHIELQFKSSSLPTEIVNRSYDSNKEDVRSILSDVCRAIEPGSDFLISGFGQDRWPVDVGTDLVIFLEQLPTAIQAIESEASTEIDFYEQGVERSIQFSPKDDCYVAECISGTSWKPDPAIEIIKRKELTDILLAVKSRFSYALEMAAPDLVQHPWVQDWLKSN